MKQVKAIIDDKIYIPIFDIEKFDRYKIMEEFSFTIPSYQGDDEVINLSSLRKINGEGFLTLPPNKSSVSDVLVKFGYEVVYEDNRCDVQVENFPKVNLEFREKPINQKEIYKKLEETGFDSILSVDTGGGKTTMSIKIAELLKAPMLFIASQVTYIKNFEKEVQEFTQGGLKENHCTINSEWLDNGAEIKPFMSCSTKALQNPDIVDALYNRFSFMVADEVHKSVTGEKTREAMYRLNPKYTLFLSATYQHKAKGFSEKLLSNNVVTVNEKIDFNIMVKPIKVDFPMSFKKYMWSISQNYHEKKAAIANNEDFMKALADTVAFGVSKGRYAMIYNTSQDFHENISEELESRGVKTAIINSNTKEDKGKTLKRFENGEIDVLIGGGSLTAGVSLYRLSTIYDTELSMSPNDSKQLLGRLKRKKEKVCPKSKLYFKFYFAQINELYQYESWTEALTPLPIIKWFKTTKLKTDEILPFVKSIGKK